MGFAGRARAGVIGTGVLIALLGLIAISISTAAPAGAARIIDRGPAPPEVSKGSRQVALASPAHAAPASDEGFLTREKMLNARPADQLRAGGSGMPWFGPGANSSRARGYFTPADATQYPERIHGKLFFKIDRDGPGAIEPEIYTCSGTVVESARRNVIFTAGHCVFDRSIGDFVDEIAFVPGYENGSTPYGIRYGYQWFTTPQWAENGNFSYDIGVVTLQEPIEDLGGRKLAFDLKPKVSKKKKRKFTIYSYPSQPDQLFDGETLRGCRVHFTRLDRASPNLKPYPMAARPCRMQQGASGGGWITLGNYLNSVVSYGYCDNRPRTCGTIFGPVFSNAAKALYTHELVGGSARPTVHLAHAPPRVVRKRKVRFRFRGSASTLVRFTCRLDRQRKLPCSSKIAITNLRPGRHILRVRAEDQTGRKSRNRIVRRFRVNLPRR